MSYSFVSRQQLIKRQCRQNDNLHHTVLVDVNAHVFDPKLLESMGAIAPRTSPTKPDVKLSPHPAPRYS
ncbi:hypothetical protein [Chlorogloea sp. CCALA 695]|uniref:hypothetical protein n=1 Tax=Chlorogloea sp. CCALA 695 TaxID=2107693 RepID=UPI001E553325|nr:hypothetical protein [Chlorogloea sp. CCALA 695]